MGLREFLTDLGVFKTLEDQGKIKIDQPVYVRIDNAPYTYSTRIEDITGEFLSITGIKSQQIDLVLLTGQKINLFFLIDRKYYRARATFVKKIDTPAYQWVLRKPKLMTGYKERRLANRHTHAIEAKVVGLEKLTALKEKNEFFTKDISVGGVMLVSKLALPLNVEFSVILPAVSNAEFTCRVTRVSEDSASGKYHHGVEFINLTVERQLELINYIDHIEQGKRDAQ